MSTSSAGASNDAVKSVVIIIAMEGGVVLESLHNYLTTRRIGSDTRLMPSLLQVVRPLLCNYNSGMDTIRSSIFECVCI